MPLVLISADRSAGRFPMQIIAQARLALEHLALACNIRLARSKTRRRVVDSFLPARLMKN